MKQSTRLLDPRAALSAALAVLTALVCTALSGCTAGTTAPTTVASGSPVPAPSGGDVSQTVPASPTPEAIKTDLTAPAKPADGITVQITKVEAIDAKAQGPGEVSGPAVAVTITLDNGGSQAFDTSLMSVNLEDSKGLPGEGMIGSPANWIKGSVPQGGNASGVYVFSVPKKSRDPIKVMVSVNPGVPTVVFSGRV